MFTKFRLGFTWFSRSSSNMESLIEEVSELCFDFADNIRQSSNKQQLRKLCAKHLETVSKLTTNEMKLPDFKPGLEWVNVSEPLSLHRHLRGKIVVLDFFTYCCINCMHILPDLKRLEQEITVKDGLVVIGVHSAKFTNERNTENIESAVRRYDITHPVVNDNVEAMWRALQVHCWPTLYILGPNGEPLLMLQGEGHYNTLKIFVSEAIAFYKKKGVLVDSDIPQIVAYNIPKHKHILSYPGKLALNEDGSLLAISDSAHNRIVVTAPSGEIKHEIGGDSPGLTDGDFENARFNSPQGLAFKGPSLLYVADTENHCIREVDLEKEVVTTIVGIGAQGHDYIGGKEGAKQAISSPWDLCFVKDILYIAMAGTHQIWAFFLNDTILWKKSHKGGTCAAVVGSGREENRNNNYPSSAGLAQPSGLAFDGKYLYFADSESSTIRCINIENGSVAGLVGGATDPRNLFAFGDKDGIGIDVKLQHPLGVTWSSYDETIYIADTYNHKIKKIEKASKKCSTVGDYSVQKLHEPGGIYAFQDKIYIADTNNHAIKILNIPNYTWSNLSLELKERPNAKNTPVFHSSSVVINPLDSTLDLEIDLSLPKNYSLTKEAPSKWTLHLPGNRTLTSDVDFSLNPKWNLNIVSAKSKEQTIRAVCRLFLCIDDKCTVKELLFIFSLKFDKNAAQNARHNIKCTL